MREEFLTKRENCVNGDELVEEFRKRTELSKMGFYDVDSVELEQKRHVYSEVYDIQDEKMERGEYEWERQIKKREKENEMKTKSHRDKQENGNGDAKAGKEFFRQSEICKMAEELKNYRRAYDKTYSLDNETFKHGVYENERRMGEYLKDNVKRDMEYQKLQDEMGREQSGGSMPYGKGAIPKKRAENKTKDNDEAVERAMKHASSSKNYDKNGKGAKNQNHMDIKYQANILSSSYRGKMRLGDNESKRSIKCAKYLEYESTHR